jgi:hypothetical protein
MAPQTPLLAAAQARPQHLPQHCRKQEYNSVNFFRVNTFARGVDPEEIKRAMSATCDETGAAEILDVFSPTTDAFIILRSQTANVSVTASLI